MTEPSDLTRRAVLTIGSVGAVGSALALAGCAADEPDGSASPSVEPTLEDEPTATSGTEPDAPALGDDVGALADVPVGGSIDATIDGEPALIAQPTAGEVVAFSAICTHQQCVVAAAGEEFHCPCHGSIYEAATGEVVQGPAIDPLTPIAVAVSGDRIVTAS
ncbi:Rieske (2Fe-2S) protein [Agromyces sp. NPDC058104]|uniref:Rieske (2Fe-2S) protein n=1 Tax=Agromyces sp. NPDC058104 TaxID=3346342 RepID=UPI0036DBABC1